MIAWSLDACLGCDAVAGVVVAVPAGFAHGLDGRERVVTVDGGSTRAESVANALAAVDTEYVAIHDAARPLLTPELLERPGRGARREPRSGRGDRRRPGHRHGQEGPCGVSVP